VRIVIAGNGPAAVSAIESIRQYDDETEIVVVSPECDRAYTPCFLGRYVTGRIELDDLYFRPEDFYDKQRVEVVRDAVLSVAPAEHTVFLESGDSLSYDRLLLACGAGTVEPEVPGLKGPGVVGFRDLADAEKIRGLVVAGNRALVLGSGFVAMEAVEALAEVGMDVSVVVRTERILRRLFDAEVADAVETDVAGHGVTFLKNSDLARVERDADGGLVAALMADGSRVECDLIVTAIGMRPNVSIVSGTDVEVGNGILTDHHMRTNVPDVWAAGDLAEPEIAGVRRVNLIHPNAILTGRVAGASMVGVHRPMSSHFRDMNVLTLFGKSYLSIGSIDSPQSLSRIDDDGGLVKVFLDSNVVTGIQMMGDVTRGGIYAALIGRRLPEGVTERLMSPEFNFGDIETWPFED
jgi:NAD(P)H-nitrite reductase large subunit